MLSIWERNKVGGATEQNTEGEIQNVGGELGDVTKP